MKVFRELIAQYGERYSTATIYIAFVIVSLLVSVILFGIFHSTGVMKLVFANAVEQAEFGGAFAGFIATLVFLIRSYNIETSKDTMLTITGNVLLPDGNPIEGAFVFVEGIDRRKETDSTGWFAIKVDEQESWVVRASYEGRAAQVTVARRDIQKPVRVIFTNTTMAEGSLGDQEFAREYEQQFSKQQERDKRSREEFRDMAPEEAMVAARDVEDTRLVVLKGNLLDASVDILVSSDDNHLRAKGGVAESILDKAGPEVIKEFKRHRQYYRRLRQGDMVITTGGGTGARAIFHPAVIDLDENRWPNKDIICKVVRSSLRCAVALGAQSIAFPVLGGGTASKYLKPWDSIQAIVAEAVNHALGSDTCVDRRLRYIALHVFNQDDIQGDIHALIEHLVIKPRLPNSAVPR